MSKPKVSVPAIGQVFEVPYPFVQDTWVEHYVGEDGPTTDEVPTWKPGPRNEMRTAPYGEEYYPSVADAMGTQVLTVVGIYRPGRFPTRVFFTRQWRDPDGKVFGKLKCRIATLAAFAALTQGYRFPFEMKEQPVRA